MAHTKRAPLIFGNSTAAAYVRLGTPAAADADFYITSVAADGQTGDTDGLFDDPDDFENVTLADSEPSRSVTLTVSENDAEDSVDEIVVVGKDEKGRHLREVIDATDWDDAEVFETDAAFRSVSSVQLKGWTEATNADDITVGFGDNLGIGVKLKEDKDVVLGLLDRAVVSISDSDINTDEDDVNVNTVDLSTDTYNGSKEAVVVVNP